MAWSSACRTPRQNSLLGGKNKLAGATPIEGNNTFAVSRALTPAVALLIIFALLFMAQYLKDDLQQIFKTILDFSFLIFHLVSTSVPQQYKSPCERPLKACFSNVYWDKTYLECYNFFQ